MNAQSKVEAPPNVYQCIAAVQGALAKDGIGKNDENTFDRYKFRGIDAVYNALAPLLSANGLSILPRIIERTSVERQSKKGDPMFYVTVTAEFDLVSAADGSKHTVRTYGEAMDRSDKATNKAMAAAYKYMAFLTFAIPTEGDNDADASTPEVAQQAGMPDDVRTKIMQLCEAVGGNQAGLICKGYNVRNITDLGPDQAKQVIGRLEEKLAEKAKAETDAKAGETVDA